MTGVNIGSSFVNSVSKFNASFLLFCKVISGKKLVTEKYILSTQSIAKSNNDFFIDGAHAEEKRYQNWWRKSGLSMAIMATNLQIIAAICLDCNCSSGYSSLKD